MSQNSRPLFITTSESGLVLDVGFDEEEVRAKAVARLGVSAAEHEWRPEWGNREQLYYRSSDTGRWNSVPKTYLTETSLQDPGADQ
ncbi:hypothetical protein [Streptomyces sp. NPDC059761]|uniref:hypothetical protein n=1 Tax=Streptomyces sp. NPDC059761 TaxID=3346937 RepID=UPI003655F152